MRGAFSGRLELVGLRRSPHCTASESVFSLDQPSHGCASSSCQCHMRAACKGFSQQTASLHRLAC